ncbi:immune inhibitor A domain-containing protein [Motilimonas pumila]|uniref:M6 family metalloprotease domain-containing protein n=1 Tax=Motilimonas pumila TaxID=2303987 RepID=A0A418YF26_9GAMM|nr:immune inhibitor A domain-containing protein [Motilimonas pumila]RJG47735.1 M6 family metalloprotease domain-containing protein [Motilimonas pumila]
MFKSLALSFLALSVSTAVYAHGNHHQPKHAKNLSKSSQQQGPASQVSAIEGKKKSIIRQKLINANINSTVPLMLAQPEQAQIETVTRQDHILAILIEFPDNKASDIQPTDTINYYAGFPSEHYQEMLFAKDTYSGPNGEPLISVRNYLNQQSGGSYDIQGNVFGWYQAKHPMAYYGANDERGDDVAPRELVLEALSQAVNHPSFDMAYYDQLDPYDLDGDGNFEESDGVIDYVSIYHAAIDEAAGGPADAIWSHRWAVDNFAPVELKPGVSAFFYTIQPVDAAAGVVAHEFGHDLGLPDEYDVDYSSDEQGVPGSTVGNWSIMAEGGYSGFISGTQPTGYSPFARQFLQSTLGGNWLKGVNLHLDQLDHTGMDVTLSAAALQKAGNQVVRIDLPEKQIEGVQPFGETSFISPNQNNTWRYLGAPLDLTGATASATVKLKLNIDITDAQSQVFATAYFQGEFYRLPIQLAGESYQLVDFSTQGWVDAEVDLSGYKGEYVDLYIEYKNYGADEGKGVGIDNFSLSIDGQQLAYIESESYVDHTFFLDGFKVSTGVESYDHYYLLEWRAHTGVDEALKYTSVGEYAPGLVIWYVDTSYLDVYMRGDNSTGNHPGEGWLSVVDANRDPIQYNEDVYDANSNEYLYSFSGVANSATQVKDAAFNTQPHIADATNYEWQPSPEIYVKGTFGDTHSNFNSQFADWDDYSNYVRPATGTKLPHHGLVINVADQTDDGLNATINIKKMW